MYLTNRSDEGSCRYMQTIAGCTIGFGSSVDVEIDVADGNTVTAGTYAVSEWLVPGQPGRQAVMRVVTTDDLCSLGSFLRASQGTIVVSAVSEAGIAGSFRATFEAGSISGNFDARFCRVDAGTA